MDVTIDTSKVTLLAESYAIGVTGSDMLKVDYAVLTAAQRTWYEVYIHRKVGDKIIIDLSTGIPSQPTWTNTKTGAEQAVIDLSAVIAECCGSGGGGVGIVELTGDVLAGPGTGTVPATLSTTGVTPGTYTDPTVTVDAKGRITSISSGPGDTYTVKASTSDAVPGTLIDKIELVGWTASIVGSGGDEVLRFTDTTPGGGSGLVSVALYEDQLGINTLPTSGAWTDIVMQTALQTSTDITRSGAEYTVQPGADGGYFVQFKLAVDPGASRIQTSVRVMVDTGGGYALLGGSEGWGYTTNTGGDLQTATTGLIYVPLNAGDKVKAQACVSAGMTPVNNYTSGTVISIFRIQTAAGATAFTDLTDVPSSYTGSAGYVVKVNGTETGLEFVPEGGSVTDFTDLGDVPSTYTGAGGYFVTVKSTEDGLEFTEVTAIDGGGA